MVIVLMTASIVGGLTAALLFGSVLLSAPLGGSIVALAAAGLLSRRQDQHGARLSAGKSRSLPPHGVVWG